MIDLKQGLYNLRKDLLDNGYEIETERWQGGYRSPWLLRNTSRRYASTNVRQ